MNAQTLQDLFVSRQPILDRKEDLVGYELSLLPKCDDRCGQDRAQVATLVCAAYSEFGMSGALGLNRAYLPVDPISIHDAAIESLPADGVVLELDFPPHTAPDERTLERCRKLRERAYLLALTDYDGLDERTRPLLTLVDVVKIDVGRHDESGMVGLAGSLSRLPVQLLAQNVDSRESLARCQKIGFHLFQGNFFADTEIVSGRRLSSSQASLIRLINLAGRDTDTDELEKGFKHEPALAVNLLRLVNSAGYGLTRQIGSLRHAITLLGRRKLQRWLQLLLMTPEGPNSNLGRSVLLQVAALRGRMMEMLVDALAPRNNVLADQAFITGIMSMMPTALGLPLDEIIAQISLEPDITRALISHEGILGQTLALLEYFDAEDAENCDAVLSSLGLDSAHLNICLVESLRWVNSAVE